MQIKWDRVLGAGVEGEVWLGEDELHRKVAVKFPKHDSDERLWDAVRAHAIPLARIQHPAVVRLITISPVFHPEKEKDVAAVIMEYVAGTTLSALGSRLSKQQASRIIRDLADGLEAIHDVGLVHGDLHDGNVLIVDGGAKILDIMYTHSLSEIGQSTANRRREDDLRDLARICSAVLQKTGQHSEDAINQAYLRGASAGSTQAVAEPFMGLLREDYFLRGAVKAGEADSCCLVLHRTRRGIETTVVSLHQERALARWTVSDFLHASHHRLWRLEHRKRPVRTWDTSYFGEDWWSDASLQARASHPDNLVTRMIDDLHLVSIGEANVSIPAGSAEPAFMEDLSVFEFDRTLLVRGAIGGCVFTEQHDYSFGGGAHGSVGARFCMIDLNACRRIDNVAQALGGPPALDLERRFSPVALSVFRNTREEQAGMFEDSVSLVSARPAFLERAGEFGLKLKYITGAAYAFSDGGWHSYTISEELDARTLPQNLSSYERLPPSVEDMCGSQIYGSIGWSKIGRDHPRWEDLMSQTSSAP